MATVDSYTGNIVLFQSYGPTLKDKVLTKLVQSRTYGPYVHAAIALNVHGLTIEAGPQGIAYGKLPSVPSQYSMCAIQRLNVNDKGLVEPLDNERVGAAVDWLVSLLKTPYGYLDIVDQALDIVWPGNTLRFAQEDHFDCSNLAVAFLDKAGIWLPKSFGYPFNVSPNDLGEWFGLLPKRNRIVR